MYIQKYIYTHNTHMHIVYIQYAYIYKMLIHTYEADVHIGLSKGLFNTYIYIYIYIYF